MRIVKKLLQIECCVDIISSGKQLRIYILIDPGFLVSSNGRVIKFVGDLQHVHHTVYLPICAYTCVHESVA